MANTGGFDRTRKAVNSMRLLLTILLKYLVTYIKVAGCDY